MSNFIRGLSVLIAAVATAVGLFWQPAQAAKTRSDSVWLICLAITGTALLVLFWYGWAKLKTNPSPEARLRHNVQRVGTLMIVGFILLSLQLLREQVVSADSIAQPFQTESGAIVHDPRQDPYTVQRGQIRDTFGNVAVGTQVNSDGTVARTYPNPYISQIVGYYSPQEYGLTGLEDKYNTYLNGEQGGNPLVKAEKDLLHEQTPGNDLVLTIDPNLQKTAYNALGTANGSIVLLDANTGAVLAMVGNPHYDPSKLALDPTLSGQAAIDARKSIESYWQSLSNNASSPLLVRPTQGLYTPGSIFKTITLGSALDLGLTSLTSTWHDDGEFTIDFHRINDPNRPITSQTTWTSQQGYMFSLNAVFAQMGLKVGGANLINYANKFGFGQPIPFDLQTASSSIAASPDFLKAQTAVADTGFGQGQILTTPLEMALVAAGMSRSDGSLPKPYLVKEVRSAPTSQNPQGQVVQQTQPEVWLRPLRPETANQVRQAMIASAKDGWVGRDGGGLPQTGATIGGKTGTAEVGGGIQNAWYIAWATKNGHTFAIACVVDHLPNAEGLRDAMPRADQVLTAALATIK